MLTPKIFNGKSWYVNCRTLEEADEFWSAIYEMTRKCGIPYAGPTRHSMRCKYDGLGERVTYRFKLCKNAKIDWGWCDIEYYTNEERVLVHTFQELLVKSDDLGDIILEHEIDVCSLFSAEEVSL